MTFNDLTERAKRTLSAGDAQARVWVESEFELAACAFQAIGELSTKVMNDPSLRTLLQQNYLITLDGSGEGDLLSAVGSITLNAGEIQQEGIYIGRVTDADGNNLVPIFNYQQFLGPLPTQFAYYCLKNRVIATRAIGIPVSIPDDIVGVNGPLRVTASFAPQEVDDFPPELQDLLVFALCDVVIRKTSKIITPGAP